jgi:multisubunit Na+/H+ antiporter MnhB subunit
MEEKMFSGSLDSDENPTLFTRFFLIALLVTFTSWLAYTVLSLPVTFTGLIKTVNEHLPSSGVQHPVTAVLLNFRSYDTLLEMSVLLIALSGVWSMALPSERIEAVPGPVLNFMVRALSPFMFMVSGYLLWIGAHAPGGAFQAGSVLAASGVLLLLAGWRLPGKLYGWPLRAGLTLGLLIFIATGSAMLLFGNRFLEFPVNIAGGLILSIEVAATISIGITLTALFRGGHPDITQ